MHALNVKFHPIHVNNFWQHCLDGKTILHDGFVISCFFCRSNSVVVGRGPHVTRAIKRGDPFANKKSYLSLLDKHHLPDSFSKVDNPPKLSINDTRVLNVHHLAQKELSKCAGGFFPLMVVLTFRTVSEAIAEMSIEMCVVVVAKVSVWVATLSCLQDGGCF